MFSARRAEPLAKSRRDPSWASGSQVLETKAADGRSKNEPKSESHSDEAHAPGALFGWTNIRNVRLRDRNVAATQSGKSPGKDHQ